ncbi:MAG: amidohydrolase family protein [Bacteroidia bacterium]|nr:amidohydrolase family protein [Bacteroidia bacterium]
MKWIDIKIILLLLVSFTLQTVAAQQRVTLITNATIHTGTGEVIENGTIAFNFGKIVDIGKGQTSLYKNAKVIDGTGKHIYPGIICMNNLMGLNEIDAVRATRDFDENGKLNPNVRSLIAYNTGSKILPTALFNGILYTQAVPQGGVISGSSSLLKTTGWNWEDAVIKGDEGIHLNWPEMHVGADLNETKSNRIEKQLLEIKSFFADAEQYHNALSVLTTYKASGFNSRLDAMRGLFTGSKNLYVHANYAKSIVSAVTFIKQQYPLIKLVLVGASDAYQLTDLIKQYNIPVVVSNVHRLPSRSFEDVDQPFKTPGILVKAGIKVAIGHAGSWEARNVMFNAGTAAAYGLTKEEALQCITLNPATIMGVNARIGSLALNKDASFVICEGDILDMMSSKISAAYLEGEPIDLYNDQQKLYEKYLKKFGLN